MYKLLSSMGYIWNGCDKYTLVWLIISRRKLQWLGYSMITTISRLVDDKLQWLGFSMITTIIRLFNDYAGLAHYV